MALLTFVQKTRARFDKEAASLTGDPKAMTKIERLQKSLRPQIDAHAEAMRKRDPMADRSYLAADYDTVLHYLSDEYPAALVGSLSGDPGPIAELRSEMDKTEAKITDYVAILRGRK